MNAASSATSPVILRADATREVGVGHAMRLLALAQELTGRGVPVQIAGTLEISWVAAAYTAAGIAAHPAPHAPGDLVEQARATGARAVVLDRYELGPAWGRALREAGIPVVAFVDGPFAAEQEADLYVDQNPGSSPRPVAPLAHALAGAAYTLFRDDVLAHRRTGETAAPGDRPLRVLAVFGGTDPMGAAPVVAPLALATAVPLDLTVISPTSEWAGSVQSEVHDEQSLTVIPPVQDLAARAAEHDLVITASGSSVWELLCLGVPAAVVCVVDNQTPGYDMVVTENLATGVGHLDALRTDETAQHHAVRVLRDVFTDAPMRAARSRRGQALLDGKGRARVADAIMRLGEPRPAPSPH